MSHHTRAASAALLLATLSTGCGDVTLAANPETSELGANSLSNKTWVPSEEEPVTLTLQVPPTARSGAMVPVTVHLHNGTERAIGIGYGQSQGFDVIVAQVGVRADSGAVWSPIKMPTTSADATVTDPLQPGRDTTFQVTWPGTDDFGHSVPPGTYRVRAVVTAGLLKTRQIWTPWQRIQIVR